MERAFEKKGGRAPPRGPPTSLLLHKSFGFAEEGSRCCIAKKPLSLRPLRISSHINLTTLFSHPRVIGRESGPSFVPLCAFGMNTKNFSRDLSKRGLLITADAEGGRERGTAAAPIHLLFLRSDCPPSSLAIQCLSLCDQLSEVIKPLFSRSAGAAAARPTISPCGFKTEFPDMRGALQTGGFNKISTIE